VGYQGAVGDAVRIEMEKWGGRAHWHIPGRWLGRDEYGDWIGIAAGTLMVRPGRETISAFDQVGLVPGPGDDDSRSFLATFHVPDADTWTYVDMTTPPTWDGPVVRAVDLDLDVVRLRDGSVYVDDEDEFAEHTVTYGYPAEIVRLAEACRDRVYAAVLAAEPPFDGSHERWQRALEDLTARS
jgi:uncharacterized protein